jgi:hypothetical protein
MVSDAGVQAKWANAQGALSANVNVDPAAYTPVMQRAARNGGRTPTRLPSTTTSPRRPQWPKSASQHVRRFIDDQSNIDAILAKTQPTRPRSRNESLRPGPGGRRGARPRISGLRAG